MSDRPDECLCDVPPSCSPEDCATTPSRHCCMANGCPIHGDDAQPVPRSLPPEWERLRVEVKALEVAAYEGYGSESIIEGDAFRSVLDLMDAIAAEVDA